MKMRDINDFETLVEFLDHFRDEETCREHFAAIRFRNGEYCPHCGHKKIYSFNGGKRYRCASCKQDFTIKTGTVFGESKLPLRKWFIAIYLLSTTSKGISSIQLAKHIGVTQKTAWFMDHRLREALKSNGGKLVGTIEVDETYIGGQAKNMHAKAKKERGIGIGGKGKIMVMGMMARQGEVRARIVRSKKVAALHSAIKKGIAPGAMIYTDENRAYDLLHWRGYNHATVNHSWKQYVRGDVHTNGIESFWAMFKRGYHGVYHWMSKKHLQRYIDEFSFRWNARHPGTLDNIFTRVVYRIAESQHLPYKELIA